MIGGASSLRGAHSSRLGAYIQSILLSSRSRSRSHPLTLRVARWKVEHLTKGEVLRCAMSFFKFHDLCTLENRDADLLVYMCKPPYDTYLLSRRPQWKICKEVLYIPKYLGLCFIAESHRSKYS